MALALLTKAQANSRDELEQTLQDNVSISKKLIESGQENLVRLQGVVEGTKDRLDGLQAQLGTEIGDGRMFTPEVVRNFQETTATDRANRMEDLSHSSLEEAALRAITDKIAGGDYVEARAMINRLDPTKNSTFGVTADFYKKDLLIANALEKAGMESSEESFWHKVLTTAIAIPESLMFDTVRHYTGNVEKGVGGYQPGFWRSVDPGGDIRKQIQAWQSLDADAQAKYLPNLIQNIRSNSTRLGVYDPGRSEELLSMFRGEVTGNQRALINAFGGLDAAGFLPLFKGAGVGLTHMTEIVTGMGARKTATNRIAQAFETAAKEGVPMATQKTAIIPDELVENGLPKALNPLKVPEMPATTKTTKSSLLTGTAKINPEFAASAPKPVSHAGDVAEQVAYVDNVLNSPEFESLKAPNRFFNEEERQVAIKNTLDTIKARTKSNVLDYDANVVRLANGQEVTELDVTINKAFASPEDARNWLHQNGYGADVTNTKKVGQNFKVYDDNPGGDWLERARQKAFVGEDSLAKKGLRGNPTKTVVGIKVPVEDIKNLPGAMDEIPAPGQVKYDALKRSVEEKGFTDQNPILIRVNPNGEAYIMEGNNRVKIASEHDVKEITAEIQFIAGGEEVASPIAQIIQDTSGQYFPRVKTFMRETGFWTHDINPPKQHFIARWTGTPFSTSDFNLAAKGTTAGQVQQEWLRYIKDLNKAVTKLGPNDRTYLREVIQKGINEEKWLSPTEFDTIWRNATGKLPSDNVKAAYWNFQTANDVDFVMRNANARAELAIRGVEDVTFDVQGKTLKGSGIVEHDYSKVEGSVLDTSSGIVHKGEELTEARLKELQGQGYYLIKTEKPRTLADGSSVDQFLVKKSDVEINQLPKYVLPYNEGGHRVYADKYFVKQGRQIINPDGSTLLDRPGVFVTASTKADAAKWAETMEAARLAVRDKMTAAELDEKIFKGQRGLPTGEEFIEGLKDGTFNLDHPFEALFDRELPSVYGKSVGGKFAEESGANGFYRTHGQLYYSSKGDALKNVEGELAPTIDPFKMQNQALFNVARLSSFDDFKTSAVHRWVNTYGQYLNYNKGASPAEIFNGATVNRTVGRDFAHQIEGQREAIKRMLNFRSSFDLEKENALRRLHEWIIGDGDNALRKELSKVPLSMMDRSPVMALRGLAFDMKLGMLNIGQFFIQTSTAFSAFALSPASGMKGMFMVPAMAAYRMMRTDNMLDLLAKRGFAKLAGFKTEKEFKDYVKFIDKSGFLAFGDSHLLANSSHAAPAYAMLNAQQGIRTMGRFFFNEAENVNRTVAARIAYDEAVKKFGKADFDNFEFNEFFRARAENYSFNMSQTSAAAWQKGLLSIPTQFWAYNWRMMEAMFGKQFTGAQKARLLMAQLFMGGAAGVPMGSVIFDYYNKQAGQAPRLSSHPDDPRGPVTGTERAYAMVQRGMVDEIVHQLTGADVQYGQKLATGDFFQQIAENFAGMSEYSDQITPASILGGATYTIMGDALGSALAAVAKWTAAETGGIDGNEMARFDWEELIRQISSVNNVAFKAYFAHKYGIYQSQKGRTLVSDLPPADAFFIGLGFAPGELKDREAIMAWKEHRQDSLRESSDFVNRLWTESVRQPDKFEQNARIVSQFINFLPPNERLEVLRKAHLQRDPSDYSRLLRIRQEQTNQDQVINELAEQAQQDEEVTQ
jgi:hypothetical protein